MIPRPSGRPVAPSPPRIAPPAEKAGTLVGLAAKPEGAAPTTQRMPDVAPLPPPPPPPPSARSTLDAKPLLPARTPNRIAIVEGKSISAAMRASHPSAPRSPSAPAIPPPVAMPSPVTGFETTLAMAIAPVVAPPAPHTPQTPQPPCWLAPIATPLPVTTSIPPEPLSEEPLTFQVYTPDALASQAMPAVRTGSVVLPKEKASLAARVCGVLVGLCVVMGTAAIIILGTEEHAGANANGASVGAAVNAMATRIAPPPPVAAPLVETVTAADTATTTATSSATAAGAASTITAIPSAATPGTITRTKPKAPPRSIKNAKPPPNPYDSATAKK